jgi:hypothetical protein
VSEQPQSAGDPIPPRCKLIEVHVNELKQLFNAMDPSPFRERDLDPNAEEFIVGWAREIPRDTMLGLLVHLDRRAGMPGESAELRDAVHEFFTQRAQVARQRLRQLLKRGRTSLVIGLWVLAILVFLGELIAESMRGQRLGELIRESLLIGGWVAMWRPLEIFLYDWWPIQREALLHDRLAAMPVRIMYEGDASPEAWRFDWPAVAPNDKPRREEAMREKQIKPA